MLQKFAKIWAKFINTWHHTLLCNILYNLRQILNYGASWIHQTHHCNIPFVVAKMTHWIFSANTASTTTWLRLHFGRTASLLPYSFRTLSSYSMSRQKVVTRLILFAPSYNPTWPNFVTPSKMSTSFLPKWSRRTMLSRNLKKYGIILHNF